MGKKLLYDFVSYNHTNFWCNKCLLIASLLSFNRCKKKDFKALIMQIESSINKCINNELLQIDFQEL